MRFFRLININKSEYSTNSLWENAQLNFLVLNTIDLNRKEVMGMSGYQGSNFDRKDDNKFALIVVLFILLIIVGASFMKDYY